MVLYASKLSTPEPVITQEQSPPPTDEEPKTEELKTEEQPTKRRKQSTPKQITQKPKPEQAPDGVKVEGEELKVKVEEGSLSEAKGSKLKVKSEKQLEALKKGRENRERKKREEEEKRVQLEVELERAKKELEAQRVLLKEKRRAQREDRIKKESVQRAMIDEGLEAPAWVKSFVKSIKEEENQVREQKKPKKVRSEATNLRLERSDNRRKSPKKLKNMLGMFGRVLL